ncbi:MAG TPA: CoA ester lyase [Gordonia polyisoprenivorans]|uniref:HpcH/HpaI aldolase/citrate lyase family protein n=1 Tax=Gordonia TaxID=2053 RepID=UPI000374CDFC|nr:MULTISPECIES: CoA ester lyase [Gordonia]MBE7191212.1 CoA ester lyase [Gordonia polyisoprenivorans]MDF3285267.1 CoA ester lyase [Gordonia sp. N1V]OZC29229.1 CoA ester lyase [Gordonia polyisoprenivorans]QUD81623.1 CoA ester lyase [Gordonia polyisoprenivorans]UZF57609.1 CoA ester lyase [Gordonia polyisoprenivorans]
MTLPVAESFGNAWAPAGPAMLFCPADRPERYQKAADRADVVILDLEDAVAPENRVAAREALIAHPLDPDRTVVRINPAGTGDYRRDLAALSDTNYRVVMQAKAETVESITETALQTIALIETPTGVVRVNDIAAGVNCIGLMWGAEDLVAGLGGKSSRFGPDEPRSGTYRDVARYARSAVRLAAAANGKFAVDSVHIDFRDIDGLRDEVTDAVALGYAATACIHPSQVDIIRAGYSPSDEELQWARRVIDGAAEFGGGVFSIDGQMIDGPVFRQAEAVLSRAAASEASSTETSPAPTT